ncbi:hypothetical protein FB567DRAFT_446314 [Paraphoma chrysanthemicola]|uniref:Uncharacterized protein n=1 Tax=Paraphoma chrysanthemicola TaxID=798071 RepID=A0A8K0R0X7_9PLEO|nr:hypothetical protein FB567DRAFT_446314 [Paraphoma chrysanthemicola]
MDISSIINNTSSTPKSTNDDKKALFTAIDAANLNRVRAVLREICGESTEAFRLASEKIGGVNGGVDGDTTGTKRKAQNRYETCIQCEQEYDVLGNCEGKCVWHDGRTEPDFDNDFWADHDDDCHGIIDSEEYPEGYVWDCCQKRGDEVGCMVGRHRTGGEGMKRYRRC